jgi:2-oxoisovalerate dehydrogenase E1 component alpha subunit
VASVSSPIATQIPQAVGAAYAARLRGDGAATLVYFGEGATSANDFHVGMNFAGVWKAPCVFLCRNNQWAISVPRERQTASESIAVKALAYGMPGVKVDGNDLLAVHKVTREALERARRGEGPTLIEAYTYRLVGHSTSDDPRVYRKDEEVERWKPLDPITRMRAYLGRRGLWDDARDAAWPREVEEQLKNAIKDAESAGRPPIESMFEEVFSALPWHLVEQREEALSFGPFPELR